LPCTDNAILGFLTEMSPNFWVYLILRLSSFVLATEPMGPSRRGPVGISSKNQKSISAGVSLALDGDLKDATDWLAFAMGWIWLAFNLYLSVFLNGIAEFPAYSLKAIMVDKFERAMLIFLDTRDTLSSERRGYTRRREWRKRANLCRRNRSRRPTCLLEQGWLEARMYKLLTCLLKRGWPKEYKLHMCFLQ